MSLASFVRRMTEAGAPPEAIAIAIEALELERNKDLERKASAAAKKREYRSRPKTVQGQGEDTARTILDPSKVPPTPPLNTPTSTSSLRSNVETRKAKRGTRISDDWSPSEIEIAFAAREGLTGEDLRLEIMKFKNHWTGKAGQDAVKVDWAATWRNWVLNWKKFNGSRFGGSGKPQRGGGDFFAGLASLAEDYPGQRPVAGPADEEIPSGRFNIDG